MLATNGHQPVVGTRSTLTCAPSRRTSSTTPMSTMLMPRSAQHGSYTSRSASISSALSGVRAPVHASLLSSNASRKPVVAVPRRGSAGSARDARRPQSWSSHEPPRTDSPALGRPVRHPLPHVAGLLLRAERAGAVRVRRHRHGPAAAGLDAGAAVGVEACRPRATCGRPAARERLPFVAARQPHGPAELVRAQAQNASASSSERPVTGWSASAGASSRAASVGVRRASGRLEEAARLRVHDGPAADADPRERDRALLARLAEEVGPGGQLDGRVEPQRASRSSVSIESASYSRAAARALSSDRPG